MGNSFGAWLLLVSAGYLLGSVPFGLLIARLVGKGDLRTQGSGNIGATNATRVLGKKWGLVVLVLDALKGALPTFLLPMLMPENVRDTATVAVATAAILGHIFPVWLMFKGGKGVATALGAAGVILPAGMGLTVLVFIITVALTRLVSLGSLLGCAAYLTTGLVWALHDGWQPHDFPLVAFAIGMPLLIVQRHRSNVKRLLAGTEPKFGEPKPAKAEPAP